MSALVEFLLFITYLNYFSKSKSATFILLLFSNIYVFAFFDVSTMLVIIFWDFLMFYEMLMSPQVKRIMIIRYKLPHELSNDLRLRILGYTEISTRSQNFEELYSSAQSSYQNENFVNTSKNSWKIEIVLFP